MKLQEKIAILKVRIAKRNEVIKNQAHLHKTVSSANKWESRADLANA